MTPDLLALAPRASLVYLHAFAGDLLEVTPLSTRPLRLAHFLAQVCHETGGLRVLVENLNYSAKRLTEVWPSRFPTLAAAAAFAHDPRALANKVYGGRMGNVEPDDGWKYRGRGLLQITGRDHYARNGRELGIPLEEQPDLAITPEHALAVALETWRASGCDEPADHDDIVGVTRRINGGLIGLSDRRAWLAKTKRHLAIT
jgi:putative chitinase